MKIELKIANRYIFPKHSINFISIITFISILGISLGVASLIIVLSIFNGFRTISEQAILDVDPAIRITSKNSAYIDDYPKLVKELRSYSKVKNIVPALQTKAVIVNNDKIAVFELIAPVSADTLNFAKSIAYGTSNIDSNNVVLGIALADRLKVTIYDTLQIISTKMLEYSFHSLQLPTGITVVPAGLFQGNVKEYDLTNCYANYNIVRKITNVNENKVSYIDIFNDDLDEEAIDMLAAELKQSISHDFQVLTWKDLNRELYNIMQMERVAVFCVLSLILLIAVFNVFASLAMTVTEKKAEIAILKSIGGSDKFIFRIYLFEGLLIGIIGTVLGLITGVALTIGQSTYKWFKIDASAYIIDAIPVILDSRDVIIICIFSILLSLIATIYPAKKANQINIIQSIRSDN